MAGTSVVVVVVESVDIPVRECDASRFSVGTRWRCCSVGRWRIHLQGMQRFVFLWRERVGGGELTVEVIEALSLLMILGLVWLRQALIVLIVVLFMMRRLVPVFDHHVVGVRSTTAG